MKVKKLSTLRNLKQKGMKWDEFDNSLNIQFPNYLDQLYYKI